MNRAVIVAGATASAASRLEMPVNEYRARREAGERWCSTHKRWHPASVFQMRTYPGQLQFWRPMSSCPEGHREASRQAMQRMRAKRRAP